MTSTPQYDIRDERIYKGPQSLYGSRIVRYGSETYRARIRRDSYDDQCTAVVEIWCADKGWTEVQTVPINQLPIFTHSYVQKQPVWEDAMRTSLHTLCQLAITVLV